MKEIGLLSVVCGIVFFILWAFMFTNPVYNIFEHDLVDYVSIIVPIVMVALGFQIICIENKLKHVTKQS